MDSRITAVTLRSIDRPDIGSISFSLYTASPYILERMDGLAGISSINTVAEPYQIRHGSNVSQPNYIGGKIVTFLVHLHAETETETIRLINRLNGILQTQMKLSVVDGGIEYLIENASLASSSYNQTRISPTVYAIEFALVAESAYRVRAEVFEKVISAGGDVVSGGIIYPLGQPYDDVVTYPDYDNAYVTVTSLQENKIVIDGNGDIYPIFYIDGTFYSVTITLTDWSGNKKAITLHAIGGVDQNNPHNWWIDLESLAVGWTTPNTSGSPHFTDAPIVEEADWFKLNVGQNSIKVEFNDGGEGVVTAKWNERYL